MRGGCSDSEVTLGRGYYRVEKPYPHHRRWWVCIIFRPGHLHILRTPGHFLVFWLTQRSSGKPKIKLPACYLPPPYPPSLTWNRPPSNKKIMCLPRVKGWGWGPTPPHPPPAKQPPSALQLMANLPSHRMYLPSLIQLPRSDTTGSELLMRNYRDTKIFFGFSLWPPTKLFSGVPPPRLFPPLQPASSVPP
nr:hypothetical protein [Morchella crassipes]